MTLTLFLPLTKSYYFHFHETSFSHISGHTLSTVPIFDIAQCLKASSSTDPCNGGGWPEEGLEALVLPADGLRHRSGGTQWRGEARSPPRSGNLERAKHRIVMIRVWSVWHKVEKHRLETIDFSLEKHTDLAGMRSKRSSWTGGRHQRRRMAEEPEQPFWPGRKLLRTWKRTHSHRWRTGLMGS